MGKRLRERQRRLHGSKAMSARKQHDMVFIVLVTVVAALFSFTLFLAVYVQTGGYLKDGPFIPANRTDTEITPAKLTYVIWLPICLWQASWIVHVVTCIFRRNEDGPVYINPQVLSYTFLTTYAASLLLLCGLVFVETTDDATWSLLVKLTLQTTLYLVLISYYVKMKDACKRIMRRQRGDLLFMRVLIQNGIALYATWCTVLTLVGLTTELVTRFHMTQEAAATFSLFILSLKLIIFFIFDAIVFDRYTRYTLTTYPTVIWALIGILARNFTRERKHMAVAVALIPITTTMFAIKLTIAVRRRKWDPLDYDAPKKTSASSV